MTTYQISKMSKKIHFCSSSSSRIKRRKSRNYGKTILKWAQLYSTGPGKFQQPEKRIAPHNGKTENYLMIPKIIAHTEHHS